MSKTSEKTIDKNLPNKLTLSRIALIPVFMVVLCLPLMTNGAVSAFWTRIVSSAVFLFCALSDFFDGKLARKYDLVSNFGKFMDPLADKFLIIGALLACVLVFDEFRAALVVSLAVIIFRELAVSGMRMIAKGADGTVIAAAMPGKIKTAAQCVFVMLLLLEDVVFFFIPFVVTYRPFTWACMAVMLFFTVYSGIDYFKTYKHYIFD